MTLCTFYDQFNLLQHSLIFNHFFSLDAGWVRWCKYAALLLHLKTNHNTTIKLDNQKYQNYIHTISKLGHNYLGSIPLFYSFVNYVLGKTIF